VTAVGGALPRTIGLPGARPPSDPPVARGDDHPHGQPAGRRDRPRPCNGLSRTAAQPV